MEDLVVLGIGDAAFSQYDKSVGVSIILLGNKTNNTVSPLFWKTKSINRVCHRAKAAEMRNLTEEFCKS